LPILFSPRYFFALLVFAFLRGKYIEKIIYFRTCWKITIKRIYGIKYKKQKKVKITDYSGNNQQV